MTNDTVAEEPTEGPVIDPVVEEPAEAEADACNSTLCVAPHGACDIDVNDTTCVCNYGWTGAQCESSVVNRQGAGYLVLVWFLGVALLSLLCLLCLLLIARIVFQAWPVTRKSLGGTVGFSIAVVAVAFAACFFRIFYYALDPYAFNNTFAPCTLWSLDYVSTALTGIAFLMLLLQWIRVAGGVRVTKGSKFVTVGLEVLRGFVVAAIIILALLLPPACATACICVGGTSPCGDLVSDYVFFIPWTILIALASILAVVLGIVLIRLMVISSGNSRSRSTNRLLRFTLSTGLSVLTIMMLFGFVCYLFVAYAESETAFLATEALQVSLIILSISSILIVLLNAGQATDKRGSSSLSSAASRNRASITSVASRDSAMDTTSPRSDVVGGDDDPNGARTSDHGMVAPGGAPFAVSESYDYGETIVL